MKCLKSLMLVVLFLNLFLSRGFAVAVGDESRENATLSGNISSEENRTSPVEGQISFTSDYVYHGQTQTDGNPAIQGGLDYRYPLGVSLGDISIGIWGSNVRLPESGAASGATIEMNFSAAYSYAFSRRVAASLGVTYFAYFRKGNGDCYNIPLKLKIGNIKTELSYTPRVGGLDGDGWYLNAGYGEELLLGVKGGFAVGYSIFSAKVEEENYADFRIALSRDIFGLEGEAAYAVVDRPHLGGSDDSRFIFTLTKSL